MLGYFLAGRKPGAKNPDGSFNPWGPAPAPVAAPKAVPTDSVWNPNTETWDASPGRKPPTGSASTGSGLTGLTQDQAQQPDEQVAVSPQQGISDAGPAPKPVPTDSSWNEQTQTWDASSGLIAPVGSASTGQVPNTPQDQVATNDQSGLVGTPEQTAWTQAQEQSRIPDPSKQDIFGKQITYNDQGLAVLPDGSVTDPRMVPYTRQLTDDPRVQEWLNWKYEESPAYKFQLSEGMNAIETSAAARGDLLSGATMKGLQRYGQGLASQDFNQERAISDSRMTDAFNMDRQMKSDAYRDRASALGEYYDQYKMWQDQYNQAMQEFGNAANMFSNAAGLGQGAAGQSASQSQQYGDNVSNAMKVYGNTQSNLNTGGAAIMANAGNRAAGALADATAQSGLIGAQEANNQGKIFTQTQQNTAPYSGKYFQTW